MRHVMIDRTTQRVVNIILWDGQSEFVIDFDGEIRGIKDDEPCRIGDVWTGQKFVDPVPRVTNPMNVTLEAPIVAKPFTYNGIGWSTIAQGPLPVGARMPLDDKPGIWLVGDKVPGIEGYSVTRVA